MPRLARGAMPWLLVSLAATLLLLFGALFVFPWLFLTAILAGIVFLFFLQFFRDPERAVAEGVASPADGKVVRIDQVEDQVLGTVDRVAIFMSPKDVHVNRFPLDAQVVAVTHVKGGHIPAFNKDAHQNERVEWLLETEIGRVKVIQIAGTVARRIVPYMSGGETVQKGDRMGLIRMGSRCDILVPPGSVAWSVQIGQQVHGAKDRIGTVATASSTGASKASKGAQRPAARKPATKPSAKKAVATKAAVKQKAAAKQAGKKRKAEGKA